MTEDELVKLTWVESELEASMVVNLLGSHGILATGPHGVVFPTQGLGRGVGLLGGMSIWVRASDLERAQRLTA